LTIVTKYHTVNSRRLIEFHGEILDNHKQYGGINMEKILPGEIYISRRPVQTASGHKLVRCLRAPSGSIWVSAEDLGVTEECDPGATRGGGFPDFHHLQQLPEDKRGGEGASGLAPPTKNESGGDFEPE
jgi:hypothetical protein